MHGPVGGILAGASRNQRVGVALLPQEAEDRIERRQADRPLAQPFGVQPVLIEDQPGRKDIRDALVKAGDEHAADAGFSHVGLRWPGATDHEAPRAGRQRGHVAAHGEHGYHRLCAVFTDACLAPAAARLAEGRWRVRELLDALRTRVLTAAELERFGDPHRLLANANTPADWTDLETLPGHKS